MNQFLFGKVNASIICKEPTASVCLFDNATPQGIGIVVICKAKHVNTSELKLHFRPGAIFALVVASESDGKSIYVHFVTTKTKAVFFALRKRIVGKARDVPVMKLADALHKTFGVVFRSYFESIHVNLKKLFTMLQY